MTADYTSDSAVDRLAAVRQAIANCLVASGYTLRGRSVERSRLTYLRELEKDLVQEVNQSSGAASVAIQSRVT